MSQKPICAVVFDFDGTLASVPLDFVEMKNRIAAVAEAYLDERPVNPGLPALEWLDVLAAEIAAVEDVDAGKEFHTRGRFVITSMEIEAARQGRLFPFVRPALDLLRSRDIQCGVITRNITPAVKAVFPDILDYCTAFIPRDDIVTVKPDPLHLITALEQMGVATENALMVGDHPMDILTGQRAGTRTAGVCSSNTHDDDIRESGADYVAADVGVLIEQLDGEGLL